MEIVTRPCKICDTPVTRNANAFPKGAICSAACAKESKKMARRPARKIAVACSNCGVMIERRAQSLRTGRPACSSRCVGALSRPTNKSQTHCKRGHEFTPENTYLNKGRGSRRCKKCSAINQASRGAEKKLLSPIEVVITSCGQCKKEITCEKNKVEQYARRGLLLACSQECQALYHRAKRAAKTQYLECFWCEKPFSRSGAVPTRGHAFCSSVCSAAYSHREGGRVRKLKQVQCGTCEKVLYRPSCRCREGKSHYCSDSCSKEAVSKRSSELTGHYRNNLKRGWHIEANGVKIRVRSSYEKLYGEYLLQNGVDFKYEPQMFKLEDGVRYTPDFYLTQTDEWIEVKGWMTEKAKRKTDLFPMITGSKLTVINTDDLMGMLGFSTRGAFLGYIKRMTTEADKRIALSIAA